MACEEYREQLMAYLDGELDEAEAARFRAHVAECETCREELDKLQRLKEVTRGMKFIRPRDAAWDQHWTCIYNRMERGAAWIFLSIGAIVLGVYGLYHLFADFFADPGMSAWIKFGVGALIVGGVALFVSVVRERIATYRVDPYREVKR